MSPGRPVVLLDVDGPLHPWAATPVTRPEGYVEHRFRLSRWSPRMSWRVWLNPRHGAELLGPAIGLPALPVIEFVGPHAANLPAWKFPAVARFAYGRAVAWLDDDFELRPAARDEFLAKRAASGAASLLVRVSPILGMTPADLDRVESWLGGVG